MHYQIGPCPMQLVVVSAVMATVGGYVQKMGLICPALRIKRVDVKVFLLITLINRKICVILHPLKLKHIL